MQKTKSGSFLIFENGKGQNIVLDHCTTHKQTWKLLIFSLISRIGPGFFQDILRTMSLKPHSIFSVLVLIKIDSILLSFSSLTALQEGSQCFALFRFFCTGLNQQLIPNPVSNPLFAVVDSVAFPLVQHFSGQTIATLVNTL